MKLIKHHTKLIVFLFFTILLLSYACKKEEYSEVPYAYVNIEISVINFLSNTGPGQYVEIYPASSSDQIRIVDPFQKTEFTVAGVFTGKGIILYHYNSDEWHAYDMTCTYKPQTDISWIKPYADSVYAVCPKCKSRFLMLDGNPMEGSLAPRPLKMYKAFYDGYIGNIYITN